MKPECDHKTATRKLRLTTAEDAALCAAADVRGIGCSEYIRHAVATQIRRDELDRLRNRAIAEHDREFIAHHARCLEITAKAWELAKELS
jgi:hypothetical protein